MPRKELVWEGEGVGYLTQNRQDKSEELMNFVARFWLSFLQVVKNSIFK
jgi:hypothetical protein